jgi:hypothetical protein
VREKIAAQITCFFLTLQPAQVKELPSKNGKTGRSTFVPRPGLWWCGDYNDRRKFKRSCLWRVVPSCWDVGQPCAREASLMHFRWQWPVLVFLVSIFLSLGQHSRDSIEIAKTAMRISRRCLTPGSRKCKLRPRKKLLASRRIGVILPLGTLTSCSQFFVSNDSPARSSKECRARL